MPSILEAARHGFTLAGAAHHDRTVRIDGRDAMGRSNPGRWTECLGGAAWNVALNLAALDHKPTLHTIHGPDATGFASAAQKFGLTLEAQESASPTANYSAIIDRHGELILAVADMDVYREFDANLVPSSSILVVDANFETGTIEALCKKGQSVIALAVSAAKAERLLPALDNIDLLFANISEVDAMGGLDRLSTKVPLIVTSDGAASLRVFDKGSESLFHVPPCQVSGDVVGAGDALAAGFLHQWANDRSVEECATFGIACAQAILAVDGPARHDLLQAATALLNR
ncbi:MAG: PfkB family carbohydrate kinase [Pseudomonadota bacterium]